MTYPSRPTGDNILPSTIFATNNTSKQAMSTAEILDGYNNDGETETQLTSRPDANRFNMFWYQVHNTVNWIISYIDELYSDKLSKTGGTMTGNIELGANKARSTGTPTINSDLTNKEYVDKAMNSAMWLGEVKNLSYPTIPSLPTGIEVVPCDGRAISRTTYADYFSMIGIAFGSGDGSTTFNIPDYRGMFLRGWDGGSNRDAGRIYGQIQQCGAPNITGSFNQSDILDSPWANGAFYMTGSGQPREGGGAADNRAYVAFNASRSSSVYKNGLTEVRPINGSIYWVVRIK